MALPSDSETSQDRPKPPELRGVTSPSPERASGILGWLDIFLSEPLRNAPPADLVRHRVLVASALFMLTLAALYLVSTLFSPYSPAPGIAGALYLTTLVATRRSTTIVVPAVVMLATLTAGFVGSLFSNQVNLEGGVHALTLLMPALAVYLLGPRRALFFTLSIALVMDVLHPLYITYVADLNVEGFSLSRYWVRHAMAAIAFLGIWGLCSLHSTARDAAHHSLEQALKELRGSESKLSSIIESTDDLVVALDAKGRLLVANSATRKFYRRIFGTDPELGQTLFRFSDPERIQRWENRIVQVLGGQRLRLEETYEVGDSRLVLDISIHPILAEGGQIVGMTLFGRDITGRKEAETRLGEMHRTLVDVSRQTGMAEVATGVLHNVGNTLNSVNISTTLVTDQLRRSRVTGLAKATALLRERAADLASFLTRDPQGQQLPPYLIAVSEQLVEERETMLKEMQALGQSVEHIKSIVSMQQKHARSAGAVEQVAVPQLIDEALRLHAVSFERLAIRIVRDYSDVPLIFVDRHKLLQILINLLSNARHALVDSAQEDKRLSIHVQLAPGGERLLIDVMDNGVGIASENAARLFTQGFTTKKSGHGFGLHISALAAEEMKGRLTCTSPGPGLGATFTLELPVKGEGV
ncbi:ATP-binding protein [Archangium lansingense]|uniref:histidine kinase n=1 Tax=Archangium lansingense TaxID=2995310 RepID=A0ABT4A2K3_9BACT|nr:ATP-binding protein [Archangium lansinium]MCY1075202.1 ATP-binding protein [Archangium lansinium]